jgi:hypothetical protein
MLSLPVRELGRRAAAQQHLMAMLQEARAQRLRDGAGTEDADLHEDLLRKTC